MMLIPQQIYIMATFQKPFGKPVAITSNANTITPTIILTVYYKPITAKKEILFLTAI